MHECSSDEFKRILNGDGCGTLNVDDEKVIYYPILFPFKVKKKNKKIKVKVPLIWDEFKGYYIKQLESYLHHRYTKQWQERVRFLLTHEVAILQMKCWMTYWDIMNWNLY